MICAFCSRSFNPEQQSPVCPHLNLDPVKPRAGGPRLRPEVQRDIEDAFNLRDREKLHIHLNSANYAARFFAKVMLDRLDELDKAEKLLSNPPKVEENPDAESNHR